MLSRPGGGVTRLSSRERPRKHAPRPSVNHQRPRKDAGMSQRQDDSVAVERSLGFLSARSLKRELLEEQRAAWEAGDPPEPEELLRRWPGDPGADPDAAS